MSAADRNNSSSSRRSRGRLTVSTLEQETKEEVAIEILATEDVLEDVSEDVSAPSSSANCNTIIKEGKRDRKMNTVFADYADPFKFIPEKSKMRKGKSESGGAYGDNSNSVFPAQVTRVGGSTSLLNSILNSSSGGMCTLSGSTAPSRQVPQTTECMSRPQQVPRNLPKERVQISLTANGHPLIKEESRESKQPDAPVKRSKGPRERSRKRSRGMPPVSVFSGITANRDQKKKLYNIVGLEQHRGNRGKFVHRIFAMIDEEYKETANLIRALLTEIAVKYMCKNIDHMACASLLQYVLRERSEIFCELLDLWAEEMKLEEAEKKAEQDLLAAQKAAADAQAAAEIESLLAISSSSAQETDTSASTTINH